MLTVVMHSSGVEGRFRERAAKSIRRIDWANLDEGVASLCHLYSRAHASRREYIRRLVSVALAEKAVHQAPAGVLP